MANVAHAALTGASLHEPKGVASADVGTVYVADGAGSGSWTILATNVLVGSVMDYAGTTVPPGSGWLLCYGQEISRAVYAALFAAIGTTYGIGDGVSTFNVPDVRGRGRFGKDNMGGTSANRLTGTVSGLDGDTLGAVGGAEAVTLTISQIPSHSHGGTTGSTDPSHTHASGTGAGLLNAGGSAQLQTTISGGQTYTITNVQTMNIAHTHTISAEGGGQGHTNMPPAIVFNVIIYAGV